MHHTRSNMKVTGTPLDTTGEHPLQLSAQLGQLLRERGWTCASAESCTGGLIGSWITSLAGSSDYFSGGVIAYSNSAKTSLLGVAQSTLDEVGAVSSECAREMAQGARQALGAEVGISSTGIAGPGGATARKPVGLIYVAVATPDRSDVRELRLNGDRLENIHASAVAALELTLHLLKST